MIKQTEIRNINRFYATDLFLYPLSTSENQRSSDVFKGFKERPLTWKGLIKYENQRHNVSITLLLPSLEMS